MDLLALLILYVRGPTSAYLYVNILYVYNINVAIQKAHVIPGVALLNMADEETKVVGPNTSAVLYGIGDLKLVS